MKKNKTYHLDITNIEDEVLPLYDLKKFKTQNKSRHFKTYLNLNCLFMIIIILVFVFFFLFLFLSLFSGVHSQKLISQNENLKEHSSQINNISNITKNKSNILGIKNGTSINNPSASATIYK